MKAIIHLAARPVVRSTAWAPVASGMCAGLVPVTVAVWRDASTDATLFALRATAVVLAAGTAFAVDDSAAVSLAASPTPLVARRGLRIGLAVAVFSLLWWAALLVAPAGLPMAGATLEALAMLAFALAVTTTTDIGAPAAGPALAVGLLGSFVLQQRWPDLFTLLALPWEDRWEGTQLRWAGILCASVAVLVASARDPAVSPRPRRKP